MIRVSDISRDLQDRELVLAEWAAAVHRVPSAISPRMS